MRNHKKTILIAILILFIACKSNQTKTEYSICIQDGKSRLEIQSEFLECFNIQASEISDYKEYRKTINSKQQIDTENLSETIQNDLMEMLAKTILLKMRMSFGSDIVGNWSYDRIKIPVQYRSFLKTTKNGKVLTGIILIKKSDLETRSIIRYLPLDYKMQVLDQKNRSYTIPKDPMEEF